MAATDKDKNKTAEEIKQTALINDVQYYLVAKYREALKSGDKSFANSCLLSTRLFSANNPNIIDEEQVMAKSDGDVNEVAKYFESIFDQLFSGDGMLRDNTATEMMFVANQMKEEMRLLLTELKTQCLKLKSTPDPLNPSNLRQAPPISSPRSRMSSEDRSSLSRDSVLKLDSHLISHKKSCFYQELFDSLPPKVRQNLLNYSIDNCDNPFERCRLMMLAITLSNDCLSAYGPKLLLALIELSDPASLDNKTVSNSEKITQRTSRAASMCQYAKSMLILDAIPLIFNLNGSQELEVNIDELIGLAFKYYAEFCLNISAGEFDLEELHGSVRKALASVDSLKTAVSLEDSLEERVNLSLNLLFDKFLSEFSDDAQTIRVLEKIRETVAGEGTGSYAQLFQLLPELEIDVEVPEPVLFSSSREDLTSQKLQSKATVTPPPKSRGRPKKAAATSVIVSPDDGLRRHLASAARKTIFIFSTYVQMFFIKSSQYLKWTRCMLPIDTSNPLANAIRAKLAKNQRCRTRQPNLDTASPAKRHKSGDAQELSEAVHDKRLKYISSPSNAQESSLKDAYMKLKHDARSFIENSEFWFDLMAAMKTDSPSARNIVKLWKRFNHESPNISEMRWIKRIQADRLIYQGAHERAVELLQSITTIERGGQQFIKREDANDERVLTVPVSSGLSPTVDVALLRATTQLIYSHMQLKDSASTLNAIADLLIRIKQTGLAVAAEDSLHEMTFDCVDGRTEEGGDQKENNDAHLDYPLLTIPSLVHYCVHILMDILQCYVMHPTAGSDFAIGHAIVLSQASWPRYSAVYDRCIDWIRSHKPKSTTPQSVSAATKFTYHDFFYFVQDPNVLEDFMALSNDGYTLDIKSNQGSSTMLGSGGGGSGGGSGSQPGGTRSTAATATRNGKAITTRGVNKSFKEDLKVALIAQMKGSCAPVPLDLIIEFVQSPLIPFLLAETQPIKSELRDAVS